MKYKFNTWYKTVDGYQIIFNISQNDTKYSFPIYFGLSTFRNHIYGSYNYVNPYEWKEDGTIIEETPDLTPENKQECIQKLFEGT